MCLWFSEGRDSGCGQDSDSFTQWPFPVCPISLLCQWGTCLQLLRLKMPITQFPICFCSKGMSLFRSSASRTCREAYWGLLGRFFCLKETLKGKFLSCFSMWLCEDMMPRATAGSCKPEESHLRMVEGSNGKNLGKDGIKRCQESGLPTASLSCSITELLNRLALHLGPLSGCGR